MKTENLTHAEAVQAMMDGYAVTGEGNTAREEFRIARFFVT